MPTNTPVALLSNALHRALAATYLARIAATVVLITFALYVTIRSRRDPNSGYWSNLINLWIGRNSMGVLVLIINIWFWSWLLAFFMPLLIRAEHLAMRALTAH